MIAKPQNYTTTTTTYSRLSEDFGGCSLEQLEWEADFFGLKELLKIIGKRKKAEKEKKAEEERREKEGPKMSSLECREKVAEMRKKSAEVLRMIRECPNRKSGGMCDRMCCSKAFESARSYDKLSSEYESKAADLRRRGY